VRGMRSLVSQFGWAAGLRSVAHQSFGKLSMSVFAENSAGSGVLFR